MWCDGIDEAITAVEGTAPWAVPHLKVHRLDEPTSARIIGGVALGPSGYAQPPYVGRLGGGLVVLSRATFDDVPPDPRFTNWGQEDEAWALALKTLVGSPWRGTDDLWHLWHPAPERLNRKTGNRDGAALYGRYRAAFKNKPRMKKLVEEYR